MISLNKQKGSGFELLHKYKGRFSLQDGLSYFGIYNNRIYTVSGKAVLGFFIELEDFKKECGLINFINKFDHNIESVFQVYLLCSKSIKQVFLFITLPFPYKSEFKFFDKIKAGISQKYANRLFEIQNELVDIVLDNIIKDVLTIFPKSAYLTDDGLNGFLNIILNHNLNTVHDIRRFIYDNININYSHYIYNGFFNSALTLKNFPEEDIYADLVFNSGFDFPFIMQITITKPPKGKSNDIYFNESDYAEQIRSIFHSLGKEAKSLAWGEDILLTQSFGDYVYQYDCTVHFFDKEIDNLNKNISLFQEAFRDFGLIFNQDHIELINVVSSYFPGLSYIFKDSINILNSDLKYLLPFKKQHYREMIKEKDKYPEFVPEAPPDLSEAVFNGPKFRTQEETEIPEIPDEDEKAKESKQKDNRKTLDIGTHKNINEDRDFNEEIQLDEDNLPKGW